MSNPQNPTTPAGWYPDPAGSARTRWWDGTQWTGHYSAPTAPAAPAAPAAPKLPQPPQQHYPAAGQAQQPGYPQQQQQQQQQYGYPQQQYGQQNYPQQNYVTPAPVLRAPEGTPPNNVFIWIYSSLLIVTTIAFAVLDLSGIVIRSTRAAIDDPTNPFASYGALLDPGYIVLIVVGFLYYGATAVLAFLDFKAQKAAGVPRPFHWAWTFLSSLVYIIGRTVIAKRRTGGGLGPMWLYFGIYLLYIVVVTVKMIAAFADLANMIPTLMNDFT